MRRPMGKINDRAKDNEAQMSKKAKPHSKYGYKQFEKVYREVYERN